MKTPKDIYTAEKRINMKTNEHLPQVIYIDVDSLDYSASENTANVAVCKEPVNKIGVI